MLRALGVLLFAAAICPLAAPAEKTSVFFVHGANVSEQDARAWAAEMFKRLWQAGANMEFRPVAWESDIGPSYNGFSPSGNWGDRYSWHKQEIWKGRKSLLGFMGTTDWSGWGFRKNAFGVKAWSAAEANAVSDVSVFVTNTVFNPYPISITNSVASRLETDFHLAQGIPALSPPTGRTRFRADVMESIDMNTPLHMANTWPRPDDGQLGGRFLHSDIKNVAYSFVHPVFRKIVEVGGLNQ